MLTRLLATIPNTGPDEGSRGDSTATTVSRIKKNEAIKAMIAQDIRESGDGGDSDVDADTGFAISNDLVELLQASNLEKRNNDCDKIEENICKPQPKAAQWERGQICIHPCMMRLKDECLQGVRKTGTLHRHHQRASLNLKTWIIPAGGAAAHLRLGLQAGVHLANTAITKYQQVHRLYQMMQQMVSILPGTLHFFYKVWKQTRDNPSPVRQGTRMENIFLANQKAKLDAPLRAPIGLTQKRMEEGDTFFLQLLTLICNPK